MTKVARNPAWEAFEPAKDTDPPFNQNEVKSGQVDHDNGQPNVLQTLFLKIARACLTEHGPLFASHLLYIWQLPFQTSNMRI